MENWKDIKDYENIYQVSNLGNVRRVYKKKKGFGKLNPIKHSGGYQRLKLRNKGNDKDVYIHRLVADAFLDRKGLKIVNHVDGDKTNNNVNNLEWVTQRENVSHGNQTGKLTGSSFVKDRNKWVSNIFINGKKHFLGHFNCETAAHFAYLKALKDNNIINKYA